MNYNNCKRKLKIIFSKVKYYALFVVALFILVLILDSKKGKTSNLIGRQIANPDDAKRDILGKLVT